MSGTLVERAYGMMVIGIAYLALTACVVEFFVRAPILDDMS